MRSPAHCVLVVTACLLLGGCRQADGQMPAPDANIQAELVDVARDLQSIAASTDPQAPRDLFDDLRKYVERPEARSAVEALSRSTATAVAGIELSEQSAQRLAHSLWVSVTADELSERQIESMQDEMRLLLLSFGVSESNAQQVAADVGDVQGAVGDRPRRWYEVF